MASKAKTALHRWRPRKAKGLPSWCWFGTNISKLSLVKRRSIEDCVVVRISQIGVYVLLFGRAAPQRNPLARLRHGSPLRAPAFRTAVTASTRSLESKPNHCRDFHSKMDLNPTFGGQELFETLSQTSAATSKSPGSQQNNSSKHHKSSSSSNSQNSPHVDEAVRRLGKRLSAQAHGETTHNYKSIPFRIHSETAFAEFQKTELPESLTPQKIVKSVTIHCKDRYTYWREQHDYSSNLNSVLNEEPRKWKHHHSNRKGLLSAVLESHSDSATSVSDNRHLQDTRSHDSPASQSISTKDTKDSRTSSFIGSTNSLPQPPRGNCLTEPSEGVANGGLDNAEGNLIVYENDSIHVKSKHIRTIRPQKARSAEFRIQKLQGQGTFAQVFQCLHVQSSTQVALKIIKNKPAYTRQAAIEVDIFQTLQEENVEKDYMVSLMAYFMHQNHLCLVFELLGMNLYEVLRRRQFRGLPITMVRDICQQAMDGVRDLSQKNIVHCDIKPENMLLVSEEVNQNVVAVGMRPSLASSPSRSDSHRSDSPTGSKTSKNSSETGRSGKSSETGKNSDASRHSKTSKISSDGTGAMASASSKAPSSSSSTIQANNVHFHIPNPTCKIKLIDFGSACFEGYTAHTYIQSRFYRSPEVLVGLPYDSAIDIWSLGCVAAELFLGLPILPGVHEHDQLSRITEMIGKVPDWMLDQGSKSSKYCVKFVPRGAQNSPGGSNRTPSPMTNGSPAPPMPQWRLKTQQEFIGGLSASEIRKKGGVDKLSKPPGNRYFKRQRLSDILVLHAQNCQGEDRRIVPAFVHFLYGVLDPDPWKRFTAFQAAQHPFVTGQLSQLRIKTDDMVLNPREENQANIELDVYWPPPWDPSICRRKLLNVQKIREKQQAMRKSLSSRPHSLSHKMETASVGSASRMSADQIHRRSNTDSSSSSLMAPSPSMGTGGRSSPPNQTSTASAPRQAFPNNQQVVVTNSAQAMANTAQPMGNLAQFVPSNAPIIGQEIFPPQQITAGSYQPAASFNMSDADFALMLERPGVVPGSAYFGTSVTSQSTNASVQSTGSTPSGFVQGLPYGMSPQSGQSSRMSGWVNVPTTVASSGDRGTRLSNVISASSSRYSVPGQHSSNSSGQVAARMDSQSVASGNSSVTMSEANFGIDPQQQQFALFQQQQQLAFLQQQQQQMLLQQRFGQQGIQQAGLQPGMWQPALGQMQTQNPQQQNQLPQPMMLAGGGGPGMYYVTTSANGQPIVLQPVGLLNQQMGQQMQGINHAGLPQQGMPQQMQQGMPQQAFPAQGMPRQGQGFSAQPFGAPQQMHQSGQQMVFSPQQQQQQQRFQGPPPQNPGPRGPTSM